MSGRNTTQTSIYIYMYIYSNMLADLAYMTKCDFQSSNSEDKMQVDESRLQRRNVQRRNVQRLETHIYMFTFTINKASFQDGSRCNDSIINV